MIKTTFVVIDALFEAQKSAELSVELEIHMVKHIAQVLTMQMQITQ